MGLGNARVYASAEAGVKRTRPPLLTAICQLGRIFSWESWGLVPLPGSFVSKALSMKAYGTPSAQARSHCPARAT